MAILLRICGVTNSLTISRQKRRVSGTGFPSCKKFVILFTFLMITQISVPHLFNFKGFQLLKSKQIIYGTFCRSAIVLALTLDTSVTQQPGKKLNYINFHFKNSLILTPSCELIKRKNRKNYPTMPSLNSRLGVRLLKKKGRSFSKGLFFKKTGRYKKNGPFFQKELKVQKRTVCSFLKNKQTFFDQKPAPPPIFNPQPLSKLFCH